MGLVVPARPQFRVANTEIRRQVDHPGTQRQQLRHGIHGHIVRCGEKNNIAPGQLIVIGPGKTQIHVTAQAGVELIDRHPFLSAGGDRHQLHFGVMRQQPQQFHARIPRAAYNTDFNHIGSRYLIYCLSAYQPGTSPANPEKNRASIVADPSTHAVDGPLRAPSRPDIRYHSSIKLLS